MEEKAFTTYTGIDQVLLPARKIACYSRCSVSISLMHYVEMVTYSMLKQQSDFNNAPFEPNDEVYDKIPT
jgi:hypothetical protein